MRDITGVFRWLRELWRSDDSEPDGSAERASTGTEGSDRSRSTPESRHVTVGLDFGTSGTKVVFRDWLSKDRTPYAVDFGVDLPGHTRFSRPSLVALDDGRILFGSEAADPHSHRDEAFVLRSGKVRLLDRDVGDCPLDVPFELPDRLAREGVSVLEGLVALFLADTLRRVHWTAAAVYPSLPPSALAYNLDIPVSQLDDDPVRRRFQRMLDVAIPLSRRLRDEMDASAALDMWAEAVSEVLGNPPAEEERPGELVPEAQAIIKGAESAVGSPSDLYHAIVDIGAGTTDVGWFKLVRAREENRLPFFAAETETVGCNDLDARLAGEVAPGSPAVQRTLRPQLVELKPELVAGAECSVDVDGRRLQIRPEDLREAARDVAPAIYEHYSETFAPAYKKERNTDRWEQIRTIVVGGGSLIPELRRPFGEHPRDFGKDVELVELSEETPLQGTGASDRPPKQEEVPFLMAALGLSHPLPAMPKPIVPSEIDELPPDPSEPTGLYDEKVDYW